jgi:hypothetical protein
MKKNSPAFRFREATAQLLQSFASVQCKMKICNNQGLDDETLSSNQGLDDETLSSNPIAKSPSGVNINLHSHRF